MEPAGTVRIVCLTLVQTIYQRPMRTDDVFSSSAMGSLMDKEIKTYGYNKKGLGQHGVLSGSVPATYGCSSLPWQSLLINVEV